MAIGSVYKLKLSANFLSQTINNIFWFENTIADLTASDLWSGFSLNIIPRIRAISSTSMTYTDVEIANIDIAPDFYTNSFSYPGVRTGGDDAPPFVSWAYTLNPNRLDRKAGAKRFAGVREGDIINGVNTGAIQSALDDLALILGSPLFVGLGRFNPIIKSVRCVKDPVTNLCTNVFTTSYPRINSAAYDAVSTQNSRKFGYGV